MIDLMNGPIPKQTSVPPMVETWPTLISAIVWAPFIGPLNGFEWAPGCP
jgi:hypothetical protein